MHILKITPTSLILTTASTRGNVIGPIVLPNFTDTNVVWHIQQRTKRAVYGPQNRPLPGGQCQASSEAGEKDKTKPSDAVPAFYHERPEVIACEIVHTLQSKAIIDLTPGSGHYALMAFRNRIPYTGVTFTKLHTELLYKRLLSRVLSCMMDANDSLYSSKLADVVSKAAAKDTAATPVPKPKGTGSAGTTGATGSTTPTPTPGGSATGTTTGPGTDARAALLARISALKKGSDVAVKEDDDV